MSDPTDFVVEKGCGQLTSNHTSIDKDGKREQQVDTDCSGDTSRGQISSYLNSHDEHLRLAGIVKGVHADLRKKYRNNTSELERIWYEHIQNQPVLSQYADAMHHLAVDHWGKNQETRIDWCREVVKEYFHQEGMKHALGKEERRKQHVKMRQEKDMVHETSLEEAPSKLGKYNTIWLPVEGKVCLLDVGSCFNPFLAFPEFQAVGIDISPATDSVFHCDFLHLRTTDHLQVAVDTMTTFINNLTDPVEWLPRECFHVVVFSLLLEYFPAPYQRWISCQRAHELLMYNGILIIVTPDSHQQHRNAQMMKSWKTAIESLGFRRWKYVKQEHLHCMVFRKVEISDKDKQEHFINGITPDMIYIPQDFHNNDDDGSFSQFGACNYSVEDEQFYREQVINELPALSSESEQDDDTGD